MPAKYSVKIYAENTIYHVYNRGVEKRTIFLDEQDYKVFLNYLKEYLSPKSSDLKIRNIYVQGRTFTSIPRQPKNYSNKIDLLAYCLMPNHFHFVIKQKDDKDSLKEFMQSLFTRYSMYFNKKYSRVGSLFQGKYKAIIVMDETYLLHLSRYIHINPYEITNSLINWYSSYAEYLGIKHTPWIKTNLILNYFDNNKLLPEFKKVNTYQEFIENYIKDSKEFISDIILE